MWWELSFNSFHGADQWSFMELQHISCTTHTQCTDDRYTTRPVGGLVWSATKTLSNFSSSPTRLSSLRAIQTLVRSYLVVVVVVLEQGGHKGQDYSEPQQIQQQREKYNQQRPMIATSPPHWGAVRILLLLSVLVSQIRPHLSLLAVKLAQHAHVYV